MAQYDKETKFYWLQLKEDFFENDAIEWLEEQQPNGRDYAYFYLKLCLKSLKSNGLLIRNVGNILIPYDNKKLAELTKMDFDTVCVAMELLEKIGLIKILENGEIYITQLENLIGSKSLGALKKQQQRMISRQKEDKCPPKIEIELKDKDKDIDIKEKNKKEKKDDIIEYFNNNIHSITPIECEKIIKWEETFDDNVIKKAIELAVNNNARNMAYIEGILKNWKNKGYKTLTDIENNNKKQSNIPNWFNQEIKEEEEMTEEELEEINNLMKGYN